MREIVHIQTGQCGNQIGTKVGFVRNVYFLIRTKRKETQFEKLLLNAPICAIETFENASTHPSDQFPVITGHRLGYSLLMNLIRDLSKML